MTDGFDPAEVEGFEEFNSKPEPTDEQIERFKQREKEEQEALEEVARKAREEQEEVTATVEEVLKMPEAESVNTPIQEERIKPDLTEVIEPETTIEEPKNVVKNAKPLVMRTHKPKEDTPPKPILSNWQRAELLDKFHKEHGNFEDVDEYVQNEEQNDNTLWQQVNKSKKRLTSEEEYHQRIEARIDDLITKIENKEIQLSDLSDEDQKVILDILNQKNG